MEKIMARYAWIGAVFWAGMKSLMANRKAFAFSALSMFGNNALYFVNWWLFFGMAGDVRGWGVSQMAVLYGTVAFAYGFAALFFGGAREIVSAIESGRLDVYLGKPRHPLPALMLAEAKPYGLGDMVTGPVLWFTLGGLSWGQGVVPVQAILHPSFLTVGGMVAAAAFYMAVAAWVFNRGLRRYQSGSMMASG